MGQSIQFDKKDSVIAAYNSRDVEAWSIWQGKQFMFKGLGGDDLESVLDALCNGGTNAIYTIKVYEGAPELINIKSNTPDDGSFNFRLNDGSQQLPVNQMSAHVQLLERVKVLEAQLIEDRENFEDEKPDGMGRIGEILGNPIIAPLLPVFVQKLTEIIMGKGSGNPAIANYTPAVINGIQEVDLSLDQIINELQERDPDLKIHLFKLLQIAKTNPDTFRLLINSLQ